MFVPPIRSSHRNVRKLNAAVEALERRTLLSGITFAPPVTYHIAAEPYAIAADDLTGNGIDDIVTDNFNGTVSILLGNGNGTFKPAQTIADGLNIETSGGSEADLALVDLGNGHPDILVTNEDSPDVSVLLGNGDGTFKASTELTPGSTFGVRAIAVDDLGNGKQDLVTSDSDGTVGVFLGNGDGTFQPGQVIATGASQLGESISIADINGDGHPDIVFLDSDTQAAGVLYGNGNGVFTGPRTLAVDGTAVMGILKTASFNGHPDLLTHYGGTVDLYLGNGDGTFAAPTQLFKTTSSASGDLVGDFNGDGHLDIGVGGGGKAVALLGNGDGTFKPGINLSVAGNVAADLNGDGQDDLVGGKANATIFVELNTTPSTHRITSGKLTTFTVGKLGTFHVTAPGFSPGANFNETGALPGGVNLNSTGLLSGTPDSGSGGTYTITITASNGVAANTQQIFTLTVDEAPAFSGATAATFVVGTTGTSGVISDGPPFPAATISATGLPRGVRLMTMANNTAVLEGDPTAGSGGVYNVSLKVHNTIGSATEVFTLTVDQPAAITSKPPKVFTVGKAALLTVTTSGFPAAGNISITESGALPNGLTFHDNGDGTATLAGTPAATTGQTYPVTLTADNGVSGGSPQVFTLTVYQPPGISSTNNFTMTSGVAGTFNVQATGFPTPMFLLPGVLPHGVTFTDNLNGTATIAGTPTAGTGKNYGLGLTVLSVAGHFTQGFNLIVDQAPAFTTQSPLIFTDGVSKTMSILTSGFPAASITDESDTLSGSGLSFDNQTGSILGKPTEMGTFTLTLDASNGVGSDAIQTFTVIVK